MLVSTEEPLGNSTSAWYPGVLLSMQVTAKGAAMQEVSRTTVELRNTSMRFLRKPVA